MRTDTDILRKNIMYIRIFVSQTQNIHIIMILVAVTCKHIDFCIRLIRWQLSGKMHTLHLVSIKIIKYKHLVIQFHKKTTVMYKNYLHVTYSLSLLNQSLCIIMLSLCYIVNLYFV